MREQIIRFKRGIQLTLIFVLAMSVAAIAGNVPNILLLSGTPDDVREYCKKLLDTVGKDGGFIMDTEVMLDEAKPENLKAMIDFTKEYGIYR